MGASLSSSSETTTCIDTGDDPEAGVEAVFDPHAVANMLFVIFREAQPAEDRQDALDAEHSVFKRAMDFVVTNLQPSPVMTHVELVVPPPECARESPMNFATYIGERSRWNYANDSNRQYYLFLTPKWRALPVHGHNAALRGRNACNTAYDVPYSLARYLTAAPVLRYVTSWIMPSRWQKMQSPAQCATLAARVIIKSVGALKWSEAAYGPSTLYAELLERLCTAKGGSAGDQAAAAPSRPKPDCEPHDKPHEVTFWIPEVRSGAHAVSVQHVNGNEYEEADQEAFARTLSHGSHDEVWRMTDANAAAGIRFLTRQVECTADAGTTASVNAQHDLAHALLTWAMCRPSCSPA